MWLLSLLTASLICAAAESLMPPGAVKRVGRLVCGMVLLCTVLSPVANLDLDGGQRWLEEYLTGLDEEKGALGQVVNQEMKTIIEEKYAAYIVDKATELGFSCTAQVQCQSDEDGLAVPWQTSVSGPLREEDRERLGQIIAQDLGVPAERQSYDSGEGSP
jgi:stage III sporulation protein AF